MIDNAWAWAKLNGKHFKHPINQAEYIEIELDTEREKKTTKGTELQTSVAFTLEDLCVDSQFLHACLCCTCQVFCFLYMHD